MHREGKSRRPGNRPRQAQWTFPIDRNNLAILGVPRRRAASIARTMQDREIAMNASLKLAIVALALTVSCAPHRPSGEPPPERELDHFKFWSVGEIAVDRQVMLKGQFDEKPWPAQIESIHFIANPVQKNDEPVLDSKTHLVAYFLRQSEKPEPRRWVTLSNQISKAARWRLTDPAFLLVPAGKTFPPNVPALPTGSVDHFVCYIVQQTDPVTKALKLVDQFDRRREMVERISKLEPAFFCLPVEKNGEPMHNSHVHLAIYDIAPHATLNPPVTVWTKDQLRPSILVAGESMMLAVPSRKTGWGPDPDGNNPT
jgi:hypothetical protein